ncbi:hypothetical protein [Brevibacterium litoralis]|uniref:hypothetical protein n=1 Tax=Brevibacterium litoralis TaxID=3138935 RepID=UPI0032ED8706
MDYVLAGRLVEKLERSGDVELSEGSLTVSFEVSEDRRVKHRIDIAGLSQTVDSGAEDAMIAMGSYRGAQSAVLNLIAGDITEGYHSGI